MRTKLLRLPNRPIEFREDLSKLLSADDFVLLQEVLSEFYYTRTSERNLRTDYVKVEVMVLQQFFVYSGKPPWMLTEEDFKRWHRHLGTERKFTVSTQRKCHGHVHSFFHFLTERSKTRTAIEQAHGIRVRQIAHQGKRTPGRSPK